MAAALAATLLALATGALGQSGPYYGLPVGHLFYTHDDTRGDIYASDPRTVVAVNFRQHARPGCTSFMAGPPKPGTDSFAPDGVILPVRVRSRPGPIGARVKRGVNLGPGFPWGIGVPNANLFPLDSAFRSFELANLRLPGDGEGQESARASFDGIDLDVGEGEEDGWFVPKPLGAEPTTPRAPVTRIRVMETAKPMKMMPIAELMKMRSEARKSAGISAPKEELIGPEMPPTAAPVLASIDEAPSGIIVFDAEKGQEVVTPRPTRPPTTRRFTRARPATRSRFTTRRPSRSRSRSRSRWQPATTASPIRRFTFPPAHEMPGWTPTLPYRRRGKSYTRTTPATRPFRARRTRPQPRWTTRAPPTTTTTATTTTQAPTTTTQALTTTTEALTSALPPVLQDTDYYRDLFEEHSADFEFQTYAPILVPGTQEESATERQPTRGERPTTTELPQPVLKEVVEEKKEELFLRFFPAIPSNSAENETDSDQGRGIIIRNPDSNETVVPQDVHPSFKGLLPRYPELYEKVESESFVFHDLPATTAPATVSTDTSTTTNIRTSLGPEYVDPEFTKAEDEFGTTISPVEGKQTGERLSIADLEWFVVEDPRAKHRRAKDDRPTPLPHSEMIDTTEAPPALPEPDHGSLFALPRINDETLLVEIPEDYTLSDFQWFGVYDHCENTRTAFVSLKDIRPPAEAILPHGIKGWQYDTESKEITVMNCNTIRLNGFTFKGHNYTNTYVYVGTGEFPDLIQQHVRAAVIGQREDEPLRDYDNEDLLIKLPEGWKTFDIDFVSIFNPAERTSYGHASIPPVVVPPCEDVFSP